MKLMIKDNGAWRTVMHFAAENAENVKQQAHQLVRLSAHIKPPELKIEDSQRAVLFWSEAKGWWVPRWAVGVEWLP